MAVANPAGLQADFTLKVFGLRFLAGIFLLIAAYGFFTWRHYQKIARKQHGHDQDTHRFHKQLRIQKMQAADDHEFLSLFVAYLEKFSTKKSKHTRDGLLVREGFSFDEIKRLKSVAYGKGELSDELREKIRKSVRK